MVDHPGEHYTHGHHESVLRAHSWRTVENSAAYLVPYLEPGASMLDVGCGPGTITVDFAKRVAPGVVIGLDAAPEIIDKARAFAHDAGARNVEFTVGDAYALDYPDDEFDIVHTHQTLQHVADPVAVLREMRRVVRHEGVVAAREVDYDGIIWYPDLPGLTKWRELYSEVHRSNGGEPNAGRHLKAWALQAGFSDVVSTASVWCFSSDADRQWWGTMWEDRVLQSAFAADALGKGIATQDDLEEVAAAWREWTADPAGWLSMTHGEILGRG
jgi:ubiquinone/menaquinone biosynthesis C-methylase UbiE